ncbi:hypothetical protein T492DRAFT_1127084 [Pavlovales sp. CCMP2436]|nr:hypothetical protein T492DRAFT_1127084 [Pavlovales sp. CCMP2436]
MQLFSVDNNVSQSIEGHAAAFAQFKTDGATSEFTLFTFAVKGALGSKLHVIETSGAPGFAKKAVDVFFPPEAANDFPVLVQNTKTTITTTTGFEEARRYLHVHDIESGAIIYMNRISSETIFVTAAHSATGGLIGVNRKGQVIICEQAQGAGDSHEIFNKHKGQVLSVSLDESTVVPYIVNQLKNMQLALSITTRGNLAPAMQGQPSPILTYFGALLERGKLNKVESLELMKPVLQQGKKDLLQKWLTEDKLTCSEELGDCIKPTVIQMALAVYVKAEAHQKVLMCLFKTGQHCKIALYAQKVKMDWNAQIESMTRINPQAACDMAQKLATNPAGSKVDFNQVTDIFIKYNCLLQATAFLLDALKNDKLEEGPLQTRLLEMNLMAGQTGVADAILEQDMLSHFDKQRIALLCEKTGLLHEGNMGIFSTEQALECLHHMMWSRSEHNSIEGAAILQRVVLSTPIDLFNTLTREHIARKNSGQLTATEVGNFEEMGNFAEVERITREGSHFDPVQARVKDFLMEACLPDWRPLINVCDRFDMVDELITFLYKCHLNKFIELYVTKVNPMKTPQVVGALLDAGGEDFVRELLEDCCLGKFQAGALIETCESRNRL